MTPTPEEIMTAEIVRYGQRAREYRNTGHIAFAELDECCAKALDHARALVRPAVADAIRAAEADEREACALVAWNLDQPECSDTASQIIRTETCGEVAAAIRARGLPARQG